MEEPDLLFRQYQFIDFLGQLFLFDSHPFAFEYPSIIPLLPSRIVHSLSIFPIPVLN